MPSSAMLPVMMFSFRVSPSGREAEYVIGRSPETGILKMIGFFGEAPKIAAQLMLGTPSNGLIEAIFICLMITSVFSFIIPRPRAILHAILKFLSNKINIMEYALVMGK
jgi:hypothetical protein